MMTIERSYHKGALLIQRSVEPVLLLVSFISIHRTSTFNRQSATKKGNFREQKNPHPSPAPPFKVGCLFFSVGSSNISTMLHGGDGGGKAICQ